MGAVNFQKQFAEPIRSGVKRSTIRRRRKNGYLPKVGETLSLYWGMRTRSCELIRKVHVTLVRPITVTPRDRGFDGVDVVLDARPLLHEEKVDLARQEGFPSLKEMALFFGDKYGEAGVTGYLIEWSPT